MKKKLQTQKEEAKKLKKSNKNMMESITYLNSLLSSVGALEHFRCPFCPKAFRSKEFLHTHLLRKHPLQANTTDLSKCLVNIDHAALDIPQRQQLLTEGSNLKIKQTLPHSTIDNKKQSEDVPHAQFDNNQNAFYDQPSTSKAYTVCYLEKQNNSAVDYLPVLSPEKKSNAELPTMQTKIKNFAPRLKDNDAHDLNEMQQHLTAMNDMVLKLSKDLELQKQYMELEKTKRSKENERNAEEKQILKENYDQIIKKLNEKLESLQATNVASTSKDIINLTEVTEIQQQEINMLTNYLKQFSQADNTPEIEDKQTKHLQREFKKMKQELEGIDSKYKMEMEKLNNQNKIHERYLKSEIDEYKRQLMRLNQQNSANSSIKEKPPILKPVPEKSSKTLIQNVDIRKVGDKHKAIHFDAKSLGSDAKTSKLYANLTQTKFHQKETDYATNDQNKRADTTTDTASSDTDGYQNPISRNKTNKTKKVTKRIKEKVMYTTDEEESDSNKDQSRISEESDKPLQLAKILEKKPSLWKQMRDVTEEELNRRLKQLNISEQSVITERDLKYYLSRLGDIRTTLKEKYTNFIYLRKSLENILDSKTQIKISKKSEDTLIPNLENDQMGTVTKNVKKLASQVHLTSKTINKVSKSTRIDREKISTQESESDLISDEKHVSTTSEKSDTASDQLNTSAEKSSTEMKVDVHAETSNSVRQNLFTSSPIETSPQYQQRQSIVTNKTYGYIKEEAEIDSSTSATLKSYSEKESPMEHSDQENVNGDEDAKMEVHHKIGGQEIRLKKPTGKNITELSKKIEAQLRMRAEQKPTGAIDIMGIDKQNISNENYHNIKPIFSDSN